LDLEFVVPLKVITVARMQELLVLKAAHDNPRSYADFMGKLENNCFAIDA
jgi:hypothetical protein